MAYNSASAAAAAAKGKSLTATAWAVAAVLAGVMAAAAPAHAQNYPVTATQRATAEQVAQAGVPLSELAPNAPDHYVVKRGDTLWAISGMYLTRPWRWPELWGMNLQQIRNPHLIYPGQELFLEKADGRARLRVGRGGASDTVKVSPRTRIEPLGNNPLPTLQPHLIEPFLSEAVIMDEATLAQAPRIVAGRDERVLLARGDRAYALGTTEPFVKKTQRIEDFRIFRTPVALKDPLTGEVLGYEALYVGTARLLRGQSVRSTEVEGGKMQDNLVPASLDILTAKGEMGAGDRLTPETQRELVSYVPRAPEQPVDARVLALHGDAVTWVGQNQVVILNKGAADGLETGHVLAVLKAGARVIDRSEPGQRNTIKLPDERTGLVMVFRTFKRTAYALVLESDDGVQVSDRVVNPR